MNKRARYNLSQKWLMSLPYRARYLIRQHLAEFLPKPDYFLISYPKSGRTWLRLMIGAAVVDELKLPPQDPTDLHKIGTLSDRFPTIQISHDAQSTNIASNQIRFRPALYRKSNVIFLSRDPRDVLTSYYYAQKYRRSLEYDMPEFASPEELIEAEKGGLRSLLKFYNVWAENLPKVRSHLLVHYEDLKADPALELRRCLEFLGLDNVSDASIAKGVAEGEFKTMQKSELAGKFHEKWAPPDRTDVNTYKVRKGVVGGYVDEFSPEAIERMDQIIDEDLSDTFARYKYRTSEVRARASR